MNCPKCQQTLADNARFCPQCGLSISGVQQPASSALPTEQISQSKARNAASTGSGSDPFVGQVLESKYEILARLGEGGMGAVYRARRVHIGDEVAVKILHQQFVSEDSTVERFRREARAAAMLQHPNIVAIYDYGEAQSKEAPAFIVMELVKGQTLRDILESEGRLAPARAVSLMKAICAGVGAAHRHHVVHRDIKPDNIIVRPPDSEAETEMAKVLDFGIAKLRDQASDQHLTQTGVVIGTPYYMSPEQCRAEELDARSDVYSLGAMLYEMLAGAPPFSAATSTGVVAKHLMEPPPPLPSNLRIPQAIEAVIMRALAKDPNARQPDASVFGRELQTAMSSTKPPMQAATVVQPPPVFTQPNYPPASTAPQYATPQPHPSQYATAPVAPRSSRAPIIAVIVTVAVIALGGAGAYLFLWPKNGGGNRNISGQQSAVASSNSNSGMNSATAADNSNIAPDISLPDIPVDEGGSGYGDVSTPSASSVIGKIVQGARLTEADLSGFSPNELRVLRNVVFARHGRQFDTPALQRFFDSQPWYRPRSDYKDSLLTPVDLANVRLIRAVESRAGGSPDMASLRQEVTDTIDGWANAVIDRDLNEHMSYYAPTLGTYYNRTSVDRNVVRADRARAFRQFSVMDVEITNLSVAVDPSGARATATFDKTYEFEGERRLSGSVQQMMWLAKTGGRWLIIGEKDLKVYYSR